MPIEVRHGEGLEGLAALVALMAGASQQQQVPQAPQVSVSGGGGRGGGGGGGGIRRSGGQLGGPVAPPGEPTLEEELRIKMQMKLKEEQFGIPIEEEKLRMEQKMEAEGWKLEYSSKARAEWAKGNESLRRIKGGVRSGVISPEEGEAMKQMVMQKMHGAEKAWSPPDPNVPIYPPTADGQSTDVGAQWTGPEGHQYTRNEKGIPVKQALYEDSREYQQLKLQAEREKATLDLQIKQDEKEEASREKYDLTRNAYKAKAFDKYSEAESDPNVALQRAETAAERLYPQLGPSRKDERQRSEFDRALEEKLKRSAQIRAAGRYGVTFTEEESNAPAEVREAILFTRAAAKQYRDNPPPPEVQAELTKALNTMREYEAEQEEQARMMQEAVQDAGPNPGWSGYGVGTDLE